MEGRKGGRERKREKGRKEGVRKPGQVGLSQETITEMMGFYWQSKWTHFLPFVTGHSSNTTSL